MTAYTSYMEQVICVFGDSISWGAWDEERGGWVNRLWLSLIEHNPYTQVYNLGIDGNTSIGILGRFESEAKNRHATVLIFQTGGNDAMMRSKEGDCQVSLDTFRKTIKEIINRSRSITDKIVFTDLRNCDETKTMPVYWDELYYTNEKIKAYSNELKSVCEAEGVQYLELEELQEQDFNDGLHPNASGHQKIFLQVQNFLIKHSWI